MFTKVKNKLEGMNDTGHAYRSVDDREEAWRQGRYEAPWLGRHFFGVMLFLFVGCIAFTVAAVATGNFN